MSIAMKVAIKEYHQHRGLNGLPAKSTKDSQKNDEGIANKGT
jgi:hypothetical protein